MEETFTEENFEAEVLRCEKPVMVDFYADWCAPCKSMAPVVEELAAQYDGQAVIGKINADDAQTLARKYRVMGIPCFLFFKGGEVAERVVGAVPKEELEGKLKAVIG